ncbi:MAG: hypothetical protein ACTSRW_17155, partial [Candidatus Helarchaeota archaeon]
ATLVGMDKKKILQMTLNTELRIALEEIFKIKTKSKKINKIPKKIAKKPKKKTKSAKKAIRRKKKTRR